MTTAVAGLTVRELAARRGMAPASLRALLRPFIEAGIVSLHEDGRLELVDRLVALAIVGEEAPEE
jgi:DNA-binding IclR family transcriptional regulator